MKQRQGVVLTSNNSEGLVISRVAESDASARDNFEGVDILLGHIEVDGNREQGAVGKSEVFDNTEDEN